MENEKLVNGESRAFWANSLLQANRYEEVLERDNERHIQEGERIRLASENNRDTIERAEEALAEFDRGEAAYIITAESLVKPTLYFELIQDFGTRFTESRDAATEYGYESDAECAAADVRRGSDLGHDYTIQVRALLAKAGV